MSLFGCRAFAVFFLLLVQVFLMPAAFVVSAQEAAKPENAAIERQRIESILQNLQNNKVYLSPEEKLEAAKEAAQLSEKTGYKAGLAKSYYFIGNCYRVANKNTESTDFLSRAAALSYQTGDSVTFAFSNIRLSNVNRKLGKMEEAFGQVYKALAIAESRHDNELLFPGYSQLASLYVTTSQPGKALLYYNKAADVSRKENNSEWLAMTYNNIGIVHYHTKDFARALEFYRKSEQLNRAAGNQVFLLDNYINMGAANHDMGQLADATAAYKNALKLSKELGNHEEYQLIILTDLGVGANSGKEYLKAIAYYKEALELAKKLKTKPYMVQIYENMALSYSNMQRYKDANDAYINLALVKDSLQSESRIEQLAEMEGKYENEKKSKQIALLQKDNQIKQDRISRRTLERNASFAVLFLVLMISVLLFRIYRQRQRTAVLLAAKNEEINRQHISQLLKTQQLKSVHTLMDGLDKERNRIAADLHDRVGSLLATVKLHFKAANQTLPDRPFLLADAGLLLDESIQEVRRISHNMVSGVLTKFGLIAAVHDLKKNLTGTGQIDMTVMAFGMEERLPLELEVPVFRVLQELVNNTLRHADATSISVQINRFDDLLNMVIEDNGTGFDPETVKKESEGMGIANIKTRLHQLRGTLSIDSGLGNGSTFIIDVPLPLRMPGVADQANEHSEKLNSELSGPL